MAETKYSKYIINDYKPKQKKQAGSANYIPGKEETHILYMGNDVLKGSFYTSAGWFWPAMMNRSPDAGASKPHTKPYDEVLGLIGSNTNDPHDLCGEAEITLGGEKHVINKSCLIYIPAGLERGPFKQTKISRPIFHFNFRMTGSHS